MTEKLFQFLWQFQYYNPVALLTASGEPLQVLHPGTLNRNQGPDFLHARIKVGNTLLVGSVELHLKASGWKEHRHHLDTNFGNVVLHVVYENDCPEERGLPVLELGPYIPKILLQQYEDWMHATSFIPCAGSIGSVNELTFLSWKERLLAERLERRGARIRMMLEENRYHWEETLWWLLAESFGTPVNREAFGEIARSLPVTLLAKHRASIHQLEALLLGQARLLEDSFTEKYPLMLQREYRYLKRMYQLQPARIPVHFLRMRPAGFPTVRLAQLAMLVHQSHRLFSSILEASKPADLKKLLEVTANDYWRDHYRFDETATPVAKKLGAAMIGNVISNTLAPLLYAYAAYKEAETYRLRAISWLVQGAAEDNAVIRGFRSLGVTCRHAADAQALMELKKSYCDRRRCLECGVGNALLKGSRLMPLPSGPS